MTRRDMAVQTAPLDLAKEPNLPQAFEDDPEDVALQQVSVTIDRSHAIRRVVRPLEDHAQKTSPSV